MLQSLKEIAENRNKVHLDTDFKQVLDTAEKRNDFADFWLKHAETLDYILHYNLLKELEVNTDLTARDINFLKAGMATLVQVFEEAELLRQSIIAEETEKAKQKSA